jgi:hypothetical protein
MKILTDRQHSLSETAGDRLADARADKNDRHCCLSVRGFVRRRHYARSGFPSARKAVISRIAPGLGESRGDG